MRSPAEGLRRVAVERALRAAALLALAGLVWAAATSPAPSRRVTVNGADLGRTLPAWTAAPPAESLAIRLQGALPAGQRDWLLALRRAGTRVAWSGPVAPLALAASWSADPVGALRVRAAAPRGETVTLSDTLGAIATATAGSGGAAITLPPGSRRLRATLAGTEAAVAVPARPDQRRVVVLGRAGWELKFVAAALEERGWPVDARAAVAPGLTVQQGRPWPPDTARHAVAVALDSLDGAQAAVLARFVRQGGGLVLGPDAARSPGLRELLPASISRRERATLLAASGADPRAALPFDRLAPLPVAAVLERRDTAAVVAARRWYAGRVVQLGYADTWRWRLSGGDGAPDEHRAWWSALVSAAAPEPPVAAAAADPAPLAGMVLALGPAVPDLAQGASGGRGGFPAALFGVFLTALLAEWASRRLRGAA